MKLLNAVIERLKGLRFNTISLDGKQYLVSDSIQIVMHGKENMRSSIIYYVNGKEIAEVPIDWTGDLYGQKDIFYLKLPEIKTLLELQ